MKNTESNAVPVQTKGAKTDVNSYITCQSEAVAAERYIQAKKGY